MSDVKKLIEAYLDEARMLQVATSVDGQPWNCTVYFAYDEDWNLFWISSDDRRHSKELRENEKVAGVIVLPHTPGVDVRGLQLQGVAKELKDKDEALLAMKHYAKRFGMPEERVTAIVEGSDGHYCYKIEPSLYVLFDEVNFPDDSRQEFSL